MIYFEGSIWVSALHGKLHYLFPSATFDFEQLLRNACVDWAADCLSSQVPLYRQEFLELVERYRIRRGIREQGEEYMRNEDLLRCYLAGHKWSGCK